MVIFDGKKFASGIEAKLKTKALDLRKKGFSLHLLTILIGDNPESVLYSKLKAKFAQRIGVAFELQQFPEYVEAKEIINFLTASNNDKFAMHMRSKIVQLPLPKNLEKDRQKILDAIDPKEDIDGLTSISFDLLKKGRKCFLPAVVRAVKEVMDDYGFWPKVKAAAVVGSSGWVGKRIFWLLRNKGIKEILTIDQGTKDLLKDLPKANLIISCVGKPGLITKNLVKEGAIVFDLGVMVVEKSKIKNQKSKIILGDVDFSEIASKASFITPVPGGIGPVTTACLFENLIESALL